MVNRKSAFVYNLELPGNRPPAVVLDGYRFTPLDDYSARVDELQHLHREPIGFGRNRVTVRVDLLEGERPAVLAFRSATRLDDILLLLSLFTMRNVGRASDPGDVVLLADHREYQFGYKLRAALPRKIVKRGGIWHDAGFAVGIQRALDVMADPDWSETYQGGRFLFLANHAFRRQILETTFVLCWTIWEHLFALHNQASMSPEAIRATPGVRKIEYCLQHYGVQASSEAAPLRELKSIRNELVHVGTFGASDPPLIVEAFVHWTEYLIGKTLGLYDDLPGWDSVERFMKELENLRVVMEQVDEQ